MRKKLIVLIIVALIALVAVVPVLAAGNGNGNGGSGNGNSNGNGSSGHGHKGPGGRAQQYFSVLGTITAIVGDTITVEVSEGSWAVLENVDVGDNLEVTVTDDTLYYEWTPDGRVPVTDENPIEVEDTTNIHGTVVDGVFTADRVTVDVVCQN